MEKEDLEKFDLEHAVAGGPLDYDSIGNLDAGKLAAPIANHASKRGLLIHLQYFPEQDRYGFTIYEEKK